MCCTKSRDAIKLSAMHLSAFTATRIHLILSVGSSKPEKAVLILLLTMKGNVDIKIKTYLSLLTLPHFHKTLYILSGICVWDVEKTQREIRAKINNKHTSDDSH